MNRCSHCGGPFGMVRRWAYYLTAWGPIVKHYFCTQKCEDAFNAEREHRRSTARFHSWLNSPT